MLGRGRVMVVGVGVILAFQGRFERTDRDSMTYRSRESVPGSQELRRESERHVLFSPRLFYCLNGNC